MERELEKKRKGIEVDNDKAPGNQRNQTRKISDSIELVELCFTVREVAVDGSCVFHCFACFNVVVEKSSKKVKGRLLEHAGCMSSWNSGTIPKDTRIIKITMTLLVKFVHHVRTIATIWHYPFAFVANWRSLQSPDL